MTFNYYTETPKRKQEIEVSDGYTYSDAISLGKRTGDGMLLVWVRSEITGTYARGKTNRWRYKGDIGWMK